MEVLTKILLLIFFLNTTCAKISPDLLLNISDGAILGRYMTSETGRTIRAFVGIPFAKPPTNELRFKPPKKIKPWNSVIKMQTEAPKCMQYTSEDYVTGEEDCLYLNVYAPEVCDTKLPVMVFFHGGGLVTGHGGYTEYGPDYILEHDVILVTGNYRLGALGFLTTEDNFIQGNFGMKDQVGILKWVQENIKFFGGDEHSVTIFGESSGSASVNFHMISPLSEGLFHKGISQSGTLYNVWADPSFPGFARENALAVAKRLSCSEETSSSYIAECLRKVPTKNIVLSTSLFEDILDYSTPFLPVMEPSTNEQPFITVESYKYNDKAKEIPWIVGFNSEEGLLSSVVIKNSKFCVYGIDHLSESEQKDILDAVNCSSKFDDSLSYWNEKISIHLGFDHLSDIEQKEIIDEINQFYFNNEGITIEKFQNVTNLYSDGSGYFGMFDVLEKRFFKNSRQNTFVYLYSHEGAASYAEIFGAKKFEGTAHMDDLLSLFPMYKSHEMYSAIPTKQDRELRKIMVKMWTNFAKTGNPTLGITSSALPIWHPASEFPLHYFRIGNENGMSDELVKQEKDLRPDRMNFWKNLKQKYKITRWHFQN